MANHFYTAIEKEGMWYGRVYHYDETGNKMIPDWTSEEPYDTKEEAEDAACEWAEENNIEADLD